MKASEYSSKTLSGKSEKDLKASLAALTKEQFNLRMQKATGQQSKGHLTRDVRKNIARVQTALSSLAKKA